MPSATFTPARPIAALVGTLLLFAGVISILLGRAGAPTIVLLLVAGPLTYAGFGLEMPTIEAAGIRLTFKPPSEKQDAGRL